MTVTPYMTLDLNDDLIRIPRVTLTYLGVPEYVQLLINPADGLLAVRACEENEAYSHRVPVKLLESAESYELHSKLLVESIREINRKMKAGKSYRLIGRNIRDKYVVVFDITKATDLKKGNINE